MPPTCLAAKSSSDFRVTLFAAMKVTRSTKRTPTKVADAATVLRLVADAERGISEQKLRRRGRPSIGEEASSAYSVRLPDELVALVDERSAMDEVTRGETVRRALIEYLTK